MSKPDRIVLERADDGERWRIRSEHPDAEGHTVRAGREPVPDVAGHDLSAGLTLEPAGEDESGQPLFRISGDDDTEGHRAYAMSDGRLKRDIRAI